MRIRRSSGCRSCSSVDWEKRQSTSIPSLGMAGNDLPCSGQWFRGLQASGTGARPSTGITIVAPRWWSPRGRPRAIAWFTPGNLWRSPGRRSGGGSRCSAGGSLPAFVLEERGVVAACPGKRDLCEQPLASFRRELGAPLSERGRPPHPGNGPDGGDVPSADPCTHPLMYEPSAPASAPGWRAGRCPGSHQG
jgi:hypothetical protein